MDRCTTRTFRCKSEEIFLMDLLSKKKQKKNMLLTWVNPACVPFQAFFIFVTIFALLFITLPSCVWPFYCMELGLKEGERLKGLVLAAEAWRALLERIGMRVS